MSETEHWLRAGVVGRPHGLDGSFLVSEPVPALLELGGEVRVGGAQHTIVRLAGHERRPIVRLEGSEDRNAAEALRGQELFAARGEAPELDEDEWWAADLQGCAVRDGTPRWGPSPGSWRCPPAMCSRWPAPRAARICSCPLVRDAVRDVDVERRVIDIDLRFLGEA